MALDLPSGDIEEGAESGHSYKEIKQQSPGSCGLKF